MNDQHEYINLEKAFGAAVLTYLKAHDNGHPSGLKDAEKIMNGSVMEVILKWKQKHNMREPYAFYSDIWEQINIRKYHHNENASSSSSSSSADASSSSSSSPS